MKSHASPKTLVEKIKYLRKGDGILCKYNLCVQEKSVKIQIEDDVDDDDNVKSKLNVAAAAPHAGQTAVGNAFLDAHIIFEPLLSSLGLMPQQITNLSLKNLGSQVWFKPTEV